MDAIISVNEAQRVVLFNAGAEQMFGCAAAEAPGQLLERFIPARFRATHRAYVRGFATTGVTNRAMGKLGSLTALRADGREFPIEASISQTEVGGDERSRLWFATLPRSPFWYRSTHVFSFLLFCVIPALLNGTSHGFSKRVKICFAFAKQRFRIVPAK